MIRVKYWANGVFHRRRWPNTPEGLRDASNRVAQLIMNGIAVVWRGSKRPRLRAGS